MHTQMVEATGLPCHKKRIFKSWTKGGMYLFHILPGHSKLFEGSDQFSIKGIKSEFLFFYLLFLGNRLFIIEDYFFLTPLNFSSNGQIE